MKHNRKSKVREGKISFLIVFIFLTLFSFNLASAGLGFSDSNKPKLESPDVSTSGIITINVTEEEEDPVVEGRNNIFTGNNIYTGYNSYKNFINYLDSDGTTSIIQKFTTKHNLIWDLYGLGFEEDEMAYWTINADDYGNTREFYADWTGGGLISYLALSKLISDEIQVNDLVVGNSLLVAGPFGNLGVCLEDGTNCPMSSGDNSSWNETRANTLYVKNTSVNSWNSTQTFTDIYVDLKAYNQNSTFRLGTTSATTSGGIMPQGIMAFARGTNYNITAPFMAGHAFEFNFLGDDSKTAYWNEITGTYSRTYAYGNGSLGYINGGKFFGDYGGTKTLFRGYGGFFVFQKTGNGNVSTASAGNFQISSASSSGKIDYGIGINVQTPYSQTASPITNLYGIYIESQNRSGITNQPYGIYQVGTQDRNYFASPTGFGTNAPTLTEKVTIVGNASVTGLLALKSITLPACSSTYLNMIGANATGTYGCNSSTWVRLF